MNYTRAIRPAATSLLLATTVHLSAASTPMVAFRFTRELTVKSNQEEIAAVPLDADIWAIVKSHAPDLRIADAQDRIVPHLLRRATAKHVRRVASSCNGRIAALHERPDNRLELELTIPADKPTADTLVLSTPLRDFERRITVVGVQPDGATTPLVTDALIYDYSRYMDMRHLEVALPRNDFRKLRVTIDTVTDTTLSPATEITRTIRDGQETKRTETTNTRTRPFRIDTAQLMTHRDQTSNREPITIAYPHVTWDTQRDPKANTTTYRIATSNVPLTELTIATPERNFSRRAIIEAPFQQDGRTQWRQIASTTLSRVSFRSFSQETLAIPFPEQAHGELHLILHHGDAPPLTVDTITGKGPQWQALFLAEPGASYKLLAGSETAKAPTSNTAHLEKLLAREIKPVICRVGDLTPNPAYDPTAGRSAWSWLSSKALFGVGIVVAIAILAIGLIRASKTVLKPE